MRHLTVVRQLALSREAPRGKAGAPRPRLSRTGNVHPVESIEAASALPHSVPGKQRTVGATVDQRGELARKPGHWLVRGEELDLCGVLRSRALVGRDHGRNPSAHTYLTTTSDRVDFQAKVFVFQLARFSGAPVPTRQRDATLCR